MLKRIRAKNYRLFSDMELEFADGLPTVLIGPNGSGKSTVLELLELGSGIALGGSLGNFFNGARGGFGSVTSWSNNHPVEIEFELAHDGRKFSYRVRISGERYQNPWIDYEEVCVDGFPVIKFEDLKLTAFDDSGVALDSQRWGGGPTESPCLRANFFGDEKADYAQRAVLRIRDMLILMLGYGPFLVSQSLVGRIPGPREPQTVGPVGFLDKLGQSLVNVLFHRQQEQREVWDNILYQVKEEFSYLQDIGFPPDPSGGRLSLNWRDKRNPDQPLFASQLSDGILQFLCLLAALILRSKMAAVVAVDEPESHLHPSAIQRLVSIANSTAAHTPVLIATHSDAILDGLANPSESVRICEVSERGASIQKLDADSLNAWLEDYSASELRERGMMDTPYSSEMATGE